MIVAIRAEHEARCLRASGAQKPSQSSYFTAPDCEASARRLGMSAGAVTVAVHRLRERYGELLREAVAHTVPEPAELDDELRYLFGLLNE